MYVNNIDRDQFRPSPQDLAHCTQVQADGDKYKPWAMKDWARKNCTSLVWWEITDMSDISSWRGPDNCVFFYFLLESDATLFMLRWS